MRQFLCEEHILLIQALSLSLSKTLVALLIAFTPADRFFKRLYGPHTKEHDKRCRAYMSLFSKMDTIL